MKILVVENNKDDLIDTISLIDNYREIANLDISFKVEYDYEKVLEIVNEYDFLLMDIELNNNVNGIELACRIREFNRDIKLVFLSNYNSYLIDGYKAKADLYLLKPVSQYEFNIMMNDLFEDYFFHNAGIVDFKIYSEKLYFHKISYIEILSRKVYIHLIDGKVISTLDTLLKWINLLNDYPFTQPHRSFIVNLEQIQTYRKKEIIMKTGETIKITDVYIDKFREDYIRYLNRRA